MPAPKPGSKKDSTNDVPMFDLEEVVRFVTKIHEGGLETAPMPKIALGCGYKHATSTPFYRRMVSSRLFGFLAKTGAELTVRARDYLKPTTPGLDKKSLADAILSIQPYASAVERFKGKKFNIELIANGLSRDLNLTDDCAMGCAKAFESSLKFAGFLGADSTVSENAVSPAPKFRKPKEDEEDQEDDGGEEETPLGKEKTQSHTIYLDHSKKRKFQVIAPIDINAAELARVKGFLAYALIVKPESVPNEGDEPSV